MLRPVQWRRKLPAFVRSLVRKISASVEIATRRGEGGGMCLPDLFRKLL